MNTTAETMRAQFAAAGLARDQVHRDPLVQFGGWLEQARDAGIREANAMSLATASGSAAPSQRSVLMKGFDADGFVFFTNHGSRKAQQVRHNSAVSALFPWYVLQRQVIIEGVVQRIGADESRDYFHSRPRDAQLGAWASKQSEALASRGELESRMAEISARFDGVQVPLPEFWGGYRIRPHRIEFWQGRTHRLHDRILYTRAGAGVEAGDEPGDWEISRLYP